MITKSKYGDLKIKTNELAHIKEEAEDGSPFVIKRVDNPKNKDNQIML